MRHVNEDVRLRSWNWPANASISGKRSLSKIRSYSNVIRPPVNCHSFFSSLFFFSSSILLLLVLFFLFPLSVVFCNSCSLSLSSFSSSSYPFTLISHANHTPLGGRTSTKVYGRANSSRCGGAKWNKSSGSPRIGEETRLFFFFFPPLFFSPPYRTQPRT